jgi:hypothetical protein
MQGYSLKTAPDELKSFLQRLTDDMVSGFPEEIVSVLLHGSLAMGSFYPPKSDIDLLIVSRFLEKEKRHKIFALLKNYQDARPYIGSLEVSVILDTDAKTPKHPLPYLVHFGENVAGSQEFDNKNLPLDADLIAHLMVTQQRGISLYGPEPKEVIGKLNWDDYLASVKLDIAWILEGENILSSPFYGVLNLCRWVMMKLSDQQIVPSKEEAGLWALENLTLKDKGIIEKALEAYRSNTPIKSESERRRAGRVWNEEVLLDFRDEIQGLL